MHARHGGCLIGDGGIFLGKGPRQVTQTDKPPSSNKIVPLIPPLLVPSVLMAELHLYCLDMFV